MIWHTSKIRKVLIIIISLLAIISLFAVGVIIYQKIKQPTKTAIEAIPMDANVIFKINNHKQLWNEQMAVTDFWKEMATFENMGNFEKHIAWLDSLIQSDAVAAKIVLENPLYISLHPSKDSLFSAMFLVEIPKEFLSSTGKFVASVANSFQMKEMNHEGVNIYTTQHKDGFSFYSYHGVFVSSQDVDLLKKSAVQIQSNKSLLNDSLFNSIKTTEGKKTDISVFINYHKIFKSLALLLNSNTYPFLSKIDVVNGWSNSDVLFRKDLLLMSGYLAINHQSYFHTVKNSALQNADFADAIDENTFYLYAISTNNYDNYIGGYEQFNALNNFSLKQETYLENDSTLSLESAKLFWSKINPQQLISSATVVSDSNVWILTVKPNDIINAQQVVFDELLSRSKEQTKIDTTDYKGFKIGKLNLGHSARLFGDISFSNIDIQYFAIGKNYINFGNNIAHLKKIIDRTESDKKLNNSYIFKSFCNDLNVNATMLVYLSPFEGRNWLKDRFNSNKSASRLMDVLAKKTPYIGFKTGEYRNNLLSASFCWKYLINSVPDAEKEKVVKDSTSNEKTPNSAVSKKAKKAESSKKKSVTSKKSTAKKSTKKSEKSKGNKKKR